MNKDKLLCYYCWLDYRFEGATRTVKIWIEAVREKNCAAKVFDWRLEKIGHMMNTQLRRLLQMRRVRDRLVARRAHRKMTILSSYVSAYWKMKRELDGASSALYFRDMHESGSKKHEDFSRHLAGHEKRTSKLVAQMARLSDRLTVIKEGSSDA